MTFYKFFLKRMFYLKELNEKVLFAEWILMEETKKKEESEKQDEKKKKSDDKTDEKNEKNEKKQQSDNDNDDSSDDDDDNDRGILVPALEILKRLIQKKPSSQSS